MEKTRFRVSQGETEGNGKIREEKFFKGSKTEIDRKKLFTETIEYLNDVYESKLRSLLKKCYQCGRCSGVCQLSKVQRFTPSRIIEMILEGFEDKVLTSGVLWDCLTCNQCLKDCPKKINFADVVRMARYRMRHMYNQKPDEFVAHKGVYTTISEIMSQPYTFPTKSLEWIPKDCEISNRGNVFYYVGCLPFFNFEFENIDPIAESTLKLLYQIEKEPIVVCKDENCCGHDLYWGQGKIKSFVKLAMKNIAMFDKAGVSTIVTACAECYRTFKVDYPNIFEDFKDKFEVKHIIEYIYENWKQNKIKFINPNPIDKKETVSFTYHDPCRLSRFLPSDDDITEKTREIFKEFKKLGYSFKEMAHNKKNSLCCGVSSWLNCNENTKALRYTRMLEANSAGSIMITSCPKCKIHLSCTQNDFEDISAVKVLDFSEFLVNHIEII